MPLGQHLWGLGGQFEYNCSDVMNLWHCFMPVSGHYMLLQCLYITTSGSRCLSGSHSIGRHAQDDCHHILDLME